VSFGSPFRLRQYSNSAPTLFLLSISTTAPALAPRLRLRPFIDECAFSSLSAAS